MGFNSTDFLLAFMPLFILIYTVVPRKYRNLILVIGSLVFYGIGVRDRLWQLWLLAGLTLATYWIGRGVAKGRRWLLIVTVEAMAGLLVVLKCVQGGRLLPAGASFFLFQITAYLVEIDRKRILPEENLLNYSAQIVMFPKLMSGPLMDPAALQHQVRARKYRSADFQRGLQKLICGLALKVLLADRLGPVWNQAKIIGFESVSTPFAWLALAAYVMRLYFDFWGYSLMAEGLGQMLGFHLPENFHEPYAARSVSEFYRRWHITLGNWFREYVYFPLGGSRQGTGKTIRNLSAVWLLTGLWHGVGGPYLVWAGMILFFIIQEKLWLGKYLKKYPFISHIYTIFVITLSWIPFAVPDLGRGAALFLRLFGLGGKVLNPMDFVGVLSRFWPVVAGGLVCMTPLPRRLYEKLAERRIMNLALYLVFWIAVYFLATAKQDPFMYFNF